MSDFNNKMKSLETTIGVLEKSYGKGTIMRLGDAKVIGVDFRINWS